MFIVRSGNRSHHAGVAMLKMGFEKVYNLAPGIIGWQGEVERGN
jgi:rhodanese-related sulfurtransferase